MNARDNLTRILRGQPAEWIPVMEFLWPDTLQKWTAQGYPTDDDGEPVSPVDVFDYDIAQCPERFHWKAKLEEEVVLEETDEWKIERDGSGAASKDYARSTSPTSSRRA